MDFNHISNKLSEEKQTELKKLYDCYYKKMCCYKKMHSTYKKWNLSLHLFSAALTSGGVIVGGLTLNPIILGSITGVGLVIQTVLVKKNFTKKIEGCKYAYQSCQKVLNDLKYILRKGDFDESELLIELKMIDDQLTDLCPAILKKYQKK